jgi:hypothetical protein
MTLMQVQMQVIKVTVLLLILEFTANLVAITPHDDE